MTENTINFKAGKQWLEDKKRCLGQLEAIKESANQERKAVIEAKTKAHFEAKDRI